MYDFNFHKKIFIFPIIFLSVLFFFGLKIGTTLTQAPLSEVGVPLPYEGSSLLAGQPILMADMTTKNIEDIEIGDRIKSYNLSTNSIEDDLVVQTMSGYHDDYLILNDILIISTDHVIYTDNGFKSAEYVQTGEYLRDSDGNDVRIDDVRHVSERIFTYDFSVQNNHNFFVSNYLVHNQGFPPPPAPAEDMTAPTVSTFSPANGATSVAVDSDLVITFSELVDAETGNISLYKTVGGVLVETFDVTTDISGSGTNVITASPASDLDSGTNYYVLIDPTAFDDVVGNSYAGITDTTTWSFTSVDIVAPIISNIATSTTETTATIIWTTDEVATSTLNYGLTDSYGSTDSSDTATTSHSVDLISLTANTTYHYQIKVWDASGNLATSSDATFTTTAAASEVAITSVATTNTTSGGSGYDLAYIAAHTPTAKPITVEGIRALIAQLTQQLNLLIQSAAADQTTKEQFIQPLHFGQNHPQIKVLQQILNQNPATEVVPAGSSGLPRAGSRGYETTYFGPATLQAVKKFQLHYQLVTTPSDPGYGFVGPKTRGKLNELLKGGN